MSEWLLALIQIEKASKWALKNSPEINSYLQLAMKKIKEQYGDPLSSKDPTKLQKPIIIKKLSERSPKKVEAKTINYDKPATRLSGLLKCDFCRKEHIGCKRYYKKTGGSFIVCSYCEAARSRKLLKKVDHERSTDMLDYTVSGSYGSGKRR